VLDVLWREFGPERLVFGSNWPVSARFASFAGVRSIVHQYFESHGSRALELYFRANALRVYGVGSSRV
jgi:L-fuconolactonase